MINKVQSNKHKKYFLWVVNAGKYWFYGAILGIMECMYEWIVCMNGITTTRLR